MEIKERPICRKAIIQRITESDTTLHEIAYGLDRKNIRYSSALKKQARKMIQEGFECPTLKYGNLE